MADETNDKKKKKFDNSNAMYGVFNEDIEDMPDGPKPKNPLEDLLNNLNKAIDKTEQADGEDEEDEIEENPDFDDSVPEDSGNKIELTDVIRKNGKIASMAISEKDAKFVISMAVEGAVENAPGKIAELVFFHHLKKAHPEIFEECHKFSEDLVNTLDPIDLIYLTKVFNDNPGNARDNPEDAIEAVKKARKFGL